MRVVLGGSLTFLAGYLGGFLLYAGWAVYSSGSVAYGAGALALLALMLFHRLEGVEEEFAEGAHPSALAGRLIFDRGSRPAGTVGDVRP